MDPLGIWAFGDAGWTLVGAPSGAAIPPSPASESGQGVVELATEAEVQSGAGGALVATAARLKAELDRRGGIAATEDALGPVKLATAAEVQAGTAGSLVASAARLKAELDRRLNPEAWISPTLLNGWVNVAGRETAGYRKTATGEVQLKGTIRDGSIATDTVLFNLPAGYRPSAIRSFVALNGGNSVCRIQVLTDGKVQVDGATTANFLSLENVRFDV